MALLMWEQEAEQCEECGQYFWPEHVSDRGVCVLCVMADHLDQGGPRLPHPSKIDRFED